MRLTEGASEDLALIEPTPAALVLQTHDGRQIPYPRPVGKATFNVSSGPGVSWAAWTWNPITGCLHGCRYCFAREIATNGRFSAAFPAGFTPVFHPERLTAPANTRIPVKHRGDPSWSRVFVGSMADNYGRWVPESWLVAVHEVMSEHPQWQYITLTKFPARYIGLDMPAGAWVGTSVDTQARVRIAQDAFSRIDGVAVKWLSLEPLLEPLRFDDLSMFDWVVIGAQTATNQPSGRVEAFAPPFEWVADIAVQAREAGCRIHLKPNLLGVTGPKSPGMQLPNEFPPIDGGDHA
jgi:protein gp37